MNKWRTTEFCENCAKEFCCTSECKYHLMYRIKQARDEMKSKLYKGIPETINSTWQNLGINQCIEILDKLIAENRIEK